MPGPRAWEWMLNKYAMNPFNPAYRDPSQRMPDETQYEYDVRRGLISGTQAIGNQLGVSKPFNPMAVGLSAVKPALDFGKYLFAPSTGPAAPKTPPGQKTGGGIIPKAAAANMPAAGPGKSFKDPGWSAVEQQAAARVGMPQLAQMLFAIRTTGEKSNADQVSSAGAKTVYQVTPGTRDLFKKKYGIDAYSGNPVDTATVAALHLKESLDRGGDPVREYIGGPDKGKWGSQTAAYGNRVWNALGNFQMAADAAGLNNPSPAFDSSGYKVADATLAQLQTNAMRPFSGTYQEQELPKLPAPEPFKAPDTSAGDTAFAAAQPKNPFGASEEEQYKNERRMQRMNYFAGMAQALGSIDWSRGVGLGELFAKLGAGAMMGAKAGNEEIQSRLDKFEDSMQRYSLALAGRKDSQARDAANVANQNITSMNQYKRELWQTQVGEIEKHQPRVENGVLVTFTKNPDGTTTQTHTPIDPARTTAITMARANNAIASANAHNEYNWQTYRMNREVAGAALPYAMADATAQNNPTGRDGIFAVGLSEAANAVTETGRWRDLYSKSMPNGAERAMQVQREAYANAGIPLDKDGNLMPGTKIDSDTQERMNAYISSQIISDFVNSQKTWALIGGEAEDKQRPGSRRRVPAADAVTSSVAATRAPSKVRRTVDSKGRVTTSETSESSISPENLSRYGYSRY